MEDNIFFLWLMAAANKDVSFGHWWNQSGTSATAVWITWSNQAAECWALSEGQSWSVWRSVFPRRLKLWSHWAPRPRSHCQLKQKHFQLLSVNSLSWLWCGCASVLRVTEPVHIPDTYTWNHLLRTSKFSDVCRSNQKLWLTSFSVVPEAIIQFILVTVKVGTSCHGNCHHHHQQTGKGHSKKSQMMSFSVKRIR